MILVPIVSLLLLGYLAEQWNPPRPRVRKLTWEEQCEEDEK